MIQELDLILDAIKRVTGVDLREAHDRRRKFTDAKHIYGWMVKRYIESSLRESAERIGLTHAMIIYHHDKACDYVDVDPEFKLQLNRVNNFYLYDNKYCLSRLKRENKEYKKAIEENLKRIKLLESA